MVSLYVFRISFHSKSEFTLICDCMLFIYKYTCQCCSALYVGQTRRHNKHPRISEHMEISPLTERKCSVFTLSGILTHIHARKHNNLRSDFKILSKAQPRLKMHAKIRMLLMTYSKLVLILN